MQAINLAIVEPELLRLHQFTQSLETFGQALEVEEYDKDLMDDAIKEIIKTFNPNIADDEAEELTSIKVISLVTQWVHNIVGHLLSVSSMARMDVNEVNEDISAMLVMVEKARTGDREVNKDVIISSLACQIEYAISAILRDKEYRPDSSGEMVAVRILSCIMTVIGNDERFNQDLLDDEPEAVTAQGVR